MARVLSTAVVLALLAATSIAFAITEGAKLEKSPIAGTVVTPIFSPSAAVDEKKSALVTFRLRTRERLTVWIQDSHGRRIATLLPPRSVRAGTKLSLLWDGFSAGGVIDPDGVYQPVVKLERSHRTIVLPSIIRLDTVPPVVTVRRPQYPIISPDGDGHSDDFRFQYKLSEPANAILAVRGRRVLFKRGYKTSGEIVWDGKVRNSQGQLVRARPGRYLLTLSALDLAGNLSKGVPFAIAQVRYVVLSRKRVVVAPGGRFALRVSTDAPTVHWKLHGRSGVQRAGTLHFRAPKSSGVYRLYVTVGKHAAVSTVVVA